MQTEQIIAAIDAEIAKLQEARQLLSDGSAPASKQVKRGRPKGSKNVTEKEPGTSKRILSPEAREKIAEAQRKRHAAKRRAAKTAA